MKVRGRALSRQDLTLAEDLLSEDLSIVVTLTHADTRASYSRVSLLLDRQEQAQATDGMRSK